MSSIPTTGLSDDASAIESAIQNMQQMQLNTNTFSGFAAAKDVIDNQGRPGTKGRHGTRHSHKHGPLCGTRGIHRGHVWGNCPTVGLRVCLMRYLSHPCPILVSSWFRLVLLLTDGQQNAGVLLSRHDRELDPRTVCHVPCAMCRVPCAVWRILSSDFHLRRPPRQD